MALRLVNNYFLWFLVAFAMSSAPASAENPFEFSRSSICL